MGVITITSSSEYGTYGFRFSDNPSLALCNLFAVGHDCIGHASYYWDGLTRADGPLLLFQYTVAGTGYLEWAGGKERLQAGKAFLVEIPGDHRYWFEEREPSWEFYYILIRPALILPNWTEIKSRVGTIADMPITSAPIQLLRHIFAEARTGTITNAYTASSYVYQFITLLGSYILHDRQNQSGWPDKIKMAVDYIASHYANLVSLDGLADELRLSKYHLQRTFTRIVGMTPHAYTQRIRTKQAMHLLRSTDKSIEEIARLIGFSSGSYFIKVFVKITGMTPGAFRNGQDNMLYNRLYID